MRPERDSAVCPKDVYGLDEAAVDSVDKLLYWLLDRLPVELCKRAMVGGQGRDFVRALLLLEVAGDCPQLGAQTNEHMCVYISCEKKHSN